MLKKINLEKLVIYDIETGINSLIFNFKDYATKVKKSFVIFQHKNYEDQPLKLFKFLKSLVRNNYTLVGFNVINFDGQVLNEFYEWSCHKQDPLYQFDNSYIIDILYNKAQSIINMEDGEKAKNLVYETKLFIPHIDLYKQLHYDRPTKATGLKWVEFAMNYPIIQEMPYEHDQILTYEQLQENIEYCWNDVEATEEFFKRVKHETELRLNLSSQYNLNLVNASEPKMAREIFAYYLTSAMGISYSELKKLKTFEKTLHLKEIIFPYIKFITPELKKVFQEIKETTIDITPNTSPKFSYSFNYHGLKVDLGLGGIHSCIKSGVYQPEEDEEIRDYDVTSMYPMLAIQNKIKPRHLGDIFCEVYNNLFLERKKYEKKDPRNYILKIVLNSLYGLSSEINSYLYDRRFTYTITINGQLSLLMYAEALYLAIPTIKILQKNTDGITFVIKKNDISKLEKVNKWWESTTKLSFEMATYSKMVIMDVNNYIAQYVSGEVKKKGLFETEMAYHKNPSNLIIPKALEQYFINNLTCKEYIYNPKNSIFDYCAGVKKKQNFQLNLVQHYQLAEIVTEMQKVCRFFVTTSKENGGLLYKDFNDGRRVSVVANTMVQPLDVVQQKEVNNYSVDYSYYEKECRKVIEQIQPTVQQKTLF